MMAFFITLMLLTSFAFASQKEQVKEANEFYKKQQWDLAIDRYLDALEEKTSHADLIQYDLGSAFYKKGNYDQSIKHLKRAVANKDKDLSAKAYYNLGNALYKKGHSLENKNLDEAINSLQKSLENYNQTLRLKSKDKEAQYNQKFVEKELERLKKKKQEQQKKKNESDSNKQKEQDQKNKQDNQNQENQQSQQNKQDQENQQNQQNQSKDSHKEQSKQEESEAQQQQPQEAKANPSSGRQQPQSGQRQKLNKNQAQEMLEEYERQDAPKGLLNFMDRHEGEHHVDKDW